MLSGEGEVGWLLAYLFLLVVAQSMTMAGGRCSSAMHSLAYSISLPPPPLSISFCVYLSLVSPCLSLFEPDRRIALVSVVSSSHRACPFAVASTSIIALCLRC